MFVQSVLRLAIRGFIFLPHVMQYDMLRPATAYNAIMKLSHNAAIRNPVRINKN